MHTGQMLNLSDQWTEPRARNGEQYGGSPAVGHIPAGVTVHTPQRDLLATVAHELRNPVSCVRNAVMLLRLASVLDTEAIEAHGVIDRQLSHMTRLIDDLMDGVRTAQGQVSVTCTRVELGEIVRHVVQDHRARLEDAGLRLTLEWPSAPVWVNGDPGRLYQIFSNLLHNANKFTDSGGSIRVSFRPHRDDVEVTVEDTGAGLDAELLKHLFEPFTQSERTRDLSRGGLGLGLSLVRGLARLQGGDVEASSAGPWRGSEFRVRLVRCPEVQPGTRSALESALAAFEDDGNQPANCASSTA